MKLSLRNTNPLIALFFLSIFFISCHRQSYPSNPVLEQRVRPSEKLSKKNKRHERRVNRRFKRLTRLNKKLGVY